MTRPVENKHLTLPVRALFAMEDGLETLRQQRPALTKTAFKERAMAAAALPPINLIRQLVAYDEDTGTFTWNERRIEHFQSGGFYSREHQRDKWNRNFAGKPAFATAHSNGYLTGRLDGKALYAHRVAWAISYGEWPALLIDHIDRNRRNNRLSNLREVDYAENAQNAVRSSGNPTPGLCFRPARGKWRVRLMVDGVERAFGHFSTHEEALAVWREVTASLGRDFDGAERS